MTFAEMFVDDAEPLRNPDQGAGTSVLERPETKESPVRDDGGDADRFAHYVSKDRIAESRATGRPVVALCGKVWVPKHDPSKYPVCPDCKTDLRGNDDAKGGTLGSPQRGEPKMVTERKSRRSA